MRVTEHLDAADRPLISFEIIPPLRGGNLRSLLQLIEDLAAHEPPFIDITSHAAQVIYEETGDGIQRRVKRKRPGTLGVCALIQNKYNIDAVPHVLCTGFTREETEDFLIEIKYLGIENVLAIRGDENGYQKPLTHGRSMNEYARDLVEQVASMNRGRYLEEGLLDSEPSNFCIGVAGYPEKHFESPNMEADLRFTREKIESGGEYIVTQMFFDNKHYFRYLEAARSAGIEVPIIPGLKILTAKSQTRNIPKNFYCEIPAELADAVEAAESAEEVQRIGVDWALAQAEDLINGGAPSLHFYVMQNASAIGELMSRLDV